MFDEDLAERAAPQAPKFQFRATTSGCEEIRP
jgi:hypothetical protein